MKKLFVLFLLLVSCNEDVKIVNSNNGEVDVNGKHCKIMLIKHGNFESALYYVDCGACENSSLTWREGKHDMTVIQPPASSCACPSSSK
jgi:hypothetical protein